MTRAPFVLPKKDGEIDLEAKPQNTTLGWRFLNPRMEEMYGADSLAQTGENVAEQYGISRQAQDAFACRSQHRVKAAQDRGVFKDEIVPVAVEDADGEPSLIEFDEHPRPFTTVEVLAGLKPIVSETGTITAGNASGINDCACALLIASDAAVEEYSLKPMARIVRSVTVGVAPHVMGIGLVTAVHKLLPRTGLSLSDIDAFELNEAFASQAVAVLRELGIPEDSEHVNPNGGAIALRHPLGCSGARLATTASRHLLDTGGQALLVQYDIAKASEVIAMVNKTEETFHRLDVIVNCVGVTHFINPADLDGLTEEMWDQIIAVNTKGPFSVIRAAVPLLKKGSSLAFVNMSSAAGVSNFGSSIAYCASKGAFNTMIKTLARALAPDFRVNAVCPGPIDSR